MVKQERTITKSANVIATLWGATRPEQAVIIGCHHDAWCHGASDPLAGTILVMEAARSFFDASQQGFTPARTIIFALWGAEEYGIIGSTEYCEAYADRLTDAVAYINLDAAAMGPNFGVSASPSLKRIIEQVTRDVPQARDAAKTVRTVWLGDRDEGSFDNLSGGSDHVGFYCHLGIPSCGLGGEGSQGTAYHSNYDTLTWYRKVVGDDYEPAIMLTRVVNRLAARLAGGALLPLDPRPYAKDFKVHLESLRKRAGELKIEFEPDSLSQRADAFEAAIEPVWKQLQERMQAGSLSDDDLHQINLALLTMEREWLRPNEPETVASGWRPWFRNLYAASDPDSGYSAWMLPVLRWAIEQKDPQAIADAKQLYGSVFDRLQNRVQAIGNVLRNAPETAVSP